MTENIKLDLTQPAISPCDYLGLLKISGEDAETFLQGQLTNDISLLSVENSQLSAFCTPKGRVLVIFRLFKKENDFYLILPKERLEIIQKRLSMFVLMSKVKIENISQQWTFFGLYKSNQTVIPDNTDQVIHNNDLTMIRLTNEINESPRLLIIIEEKQAQTYWQENSEQIQATSTDFWAWQEIKSGLPQIFNATAEAFVPQMLNLDTINGLSFTKGCYTGQEVVSRMHYLGTAKRLMFKAHIDTTDKPVAGDKLYSATSTSAQGAGKIVDAQINPNGGIDCLVVAEIKQAEANNLQLLDENGPLLDI